MDLENKVPREKNTIFNIRSIRKTLLGTAILMLVEQEQLSLYDKAEKYFSAFDNEKCRDVTIDHLLMHTAGIKSSEENDKRISHVYVLKDTNYVKYWDPSWVPESDLIICFLTQSRYNKILGNFITLAERLLY